MDSIKNLIVIDPITQIILIKMDKVTKRSKIINLHLVIKEDAIIQENSVAVNPSNNIIQIEIDVLKEDING